MFTGYISHEKTPGYLEMADMVVVASLWDEPFGVVVIEAMAMGKPVVASARGGIPEIISHTVTGLLVAKPGAESFAEACSALLSNEQFSRQLGTEARRDVENRFSWEKIVDQTQYLYEKLLAAAVMTILAEPSPAEPE